MLRLFDVDRRRLNEASHQITTDESPEYVGELLDGGSAVDCYVTLVQSKFSFSQKSFSYEQND